MEKIFQLVDKQVVSYTFSLGKVLMFVSLFMYGLYGFVTIPSFSPIVQGLVTMFLVVVCLYVGLYSSLAEKYLTISITQRDVYVMLSYVVVTALCAYKALANDIDGDQLYHAQQAMVYGLFGAQVVYNHFPLIFSSIPLRYLLWGAQVVFVVGLIAFFGLAQRVKKEYYALGVALLFIVARYAVLFEGGNESAFPPFRLFPLWVTGTLFSPSSFSFRLATYVGLMLLALYVYKKASQRISSVRAYLLGIFACTIPVVLHVGTLVEMSLWATWCFVFTLFVINDWSHEKKVEYATVVSVIVVFSCMRVSAFVTLVPVFAMLAYDVLHKKVQIKEAVRACIPLLILLPVVVASVYIGTPASYHGLLSLDPYVPAGSHLLERLRIALDSGAFMMHLYNSLRVPLVLILCVLPLLLLRRSKTMILVPGLWMVCFVLFYSIEPGLWGNGRYIAEYAAPFVIFAMYLLLEEYGVIRAVALGLVMVCVLSNVYMYHQASTLNKASYGRDVYFYAMRKPGEYFIWSELPYSFTKALHKAQEDGFAGSLYYSPGNGYGYFAEMLSGYSVEEMKQQRDIILDIGVGLDASSSQRINQDKRIKLVLVNASENSTTTLNEQLLVSLQNNGWKPWHTFTNDVYHTALVGMVRK